MGRAGSWIQISFDVEEATTTGPLNCLPASAPSVSLDLPLPLRGWSLQWRRGGPKTQIHVWDPTGPWNRKHLGLCHIPHTPNYFDKFHSFTFTHSFILSFFLHHQTCVCILHLLSSLSLSHSKGTYCLLFSAPTMLLPVFGYIFNTRM